MVRYYYTKLRLLALTWRTLRIERKGQNLRIKLNKLHTMITAGFTSELEFERFNKRLVENRHKNELPPPAKKALEHARNEYHKQWKPKKHFKDSKDKQAQREGQERSEGYVRVIKNRPLKKNPDDLVKPSEEKSEPLEDFMNRKDRPNG